MGVESEGSGRTSDEGVQSRDGRAGSVRAGGLAEIRHPQNRREQLGDVRTETAWQIAPGGRVRGHVSSGRGRDYVLRFSKIEGPGRRVRSGAGEGPYESL